MAGRTDRADRRRGPERYPDDEHDHREEDGWTGGDQDDDAEDWIDDDYEDEDADDEDDDDYEDDDGDDGADERSGAGNPPQPVSARVAAGNAARQIAGLIGKPVIGVTSLDRTERGWLVGVEVVEDARIPSSADILAVYRTELDADGELTGYRRTRRYPRGRGDNGTGVG
ncbi:gas vesicle protein GvpO [Plantactinospora endophytica]|uniref:Gas vesicle protein n=1 Tax=Plantactinospora endophytica TaxID=673535 RepID=A0ABQ4EDN1_9ACTN|nr:gas vesicle protein GvpO [Plantactinospora endophytica]GIG92826.1 hypothetical protein Pen02_77620 [Plantactinospora endophytica]